MKKENPNSPAEAQPEAVEQQPDGVTATNQAPEETPEEAPENDEQTEIATATAAAVRALNDLTATLDKHGYNVWTWGQLVNAGIIACILNKETGTAEFAPGDLSGAYLLKRQDRSNDPEEAAPETQPRQPNTGKPQTRLVNGKGGGQWVNSHYKQD